MHEQADTTVLETRHAETITLRDEERQPCEVWTRVMGYHRPVTSFNIGKQQEYSDRTFFMTPEKEFS